LTTKEKQDELSKHRIQQAEESLDEAKYLLTGRKSLRSVINRAYYAMFYAVLALLVYEPYASSKHSGVLGYFNKRFIKEGIFSENMGRSINKAFDLRQRGDYREYAALGYEQVVPFIEEASVFIGSVRDYLLQKVWSAFDAPDSAI
jgi:uncharacterized protein (UPF0332 family)